MTAQTIVFDRGTLTHLEQGAAAPSGLKVILRPVMVGDSAFIVDSWASSYRKCGIDGAAQIDRSIYNIEIRARIARLWERSNVIVGCDPGQPTAIRCYAVYEPSQRATQLPVLHYMLVRPELQRQGIGRKLVELVRQSALVADSSIFASHWTHFIKPMAPKLGILRNPFCVEV